MNTPCLLFWAKSKAESIYYSYIYLSHFFSPGASKCATGAQEPVQDSRSNRFIILSTGASKGLGKSLPSILRFISLLISLKSKP